MSDFNRVQRQAESGGMAGASAVSREVSSTLNMSATALFKRIIKTAAELRAAKTKDQMQVAEVGGKLVDSPVAVTTTERDRLEELADRTASPQKAEDKPLIDYAQNPEQKALLVAQIGETQKQLDNLVKSNEPAKVTDAQSKIVQLASLIRELGIANYIESNVLAALDSPAFSDRDTERRQERLGHEPERIEYKQKDSKFVAPDVLQRSPAKETPRAEKGRQVVPLTNAQILVVSTALQTAQYDDLLEALESEPQASVEVNNRQPASEPEIDSPRPVVPPIDGTTLVNVYKSETFEIERRGFIVSIYDATSDRTEPIFSFEQRGSKVTILKDEITNNAEVYKKFERASQNIETLRRKGASMKEILADGTHHAQAKTLGELAPRGSAAIATAALITNNSEKARSLETESGVQMIYERRVRAREDGGTYEVFTVSKEGVRPADSILAVAEDGTILTQNQPSDYVELKENYNTAQAAIAAQQAEEKSKTPTLRSEKGDEGR